MSRRLCASVFAGLFGLQLVAAQAQQPASAPANPNDPIEKIKDEGLHRSQVMATLSHLTDVIGPRLTGSPNLKRANEWTRDQLASWGLSNAHLEAWGPFGRGWSLKRFSMQVVEPQCIPLIGMPKAWSPGIEGTLSAPVVYFDARSEADFEKFKDKLKGAIVLMSRTPEVPAHFEPLATRKTDTELLELADAAEPAPRGMRGGLPPRAGRGGPTPPAAPGNAGGQPATPARNRMARFNSPEFRAQMELNRKKMLFLIAQSPAMIVEASNQGDGGTYFVQGATVPSTTPFLGFGQQNQGGPAPRRVNAWDKDAPKIIPQIVLSKEHYNRLVRMIEAGEKVTIATELQVQFHDKDLMAYNTVAEIPGSDLKEEVVMLGGHIDSWHSGTGATDNGAGVSVAMEAVRIIKALDLKPRRTIRVGLWSGEEEGLLGSRAYVREHFGKNPAGGFGVAEPDVKESAEPRPEYARFSGYFNLDNGTGKIRGVYLQGNEAVRPIFRKWLQPFRDMGAATLSLSNTGGTDHLSFDGIGLPGFQFIQDEIEYSSRTHHSNQDVFDRIQADDMKQASVIMAAFVYNTAMLDERLPRKPEAREPNRARTASTR